MALSKFLTLKYFPNPTGKESVLLATLVFGKTRRGQLMLSGRSVKRLVVYNEDGSVHYDIPRGEFLVGLVSSGVPGLSKRPKWGKKAEAERQAFLKNKGGSNEANAGSTGSNPVISPPTG